MEPTGVWESLASQGPIVVVLGVACYVMIKYIKGSLDDATEREKARELRYNALVDATIANADARTEAVVKVLERNTSVFERVERKLEEKSH